MTLHIIVPVKDLAEAKSRLAGALSEGERRALVLQLLNSVLDVVQQAQQQLNAVGAVISRDDEVLALAVAHDLAALREQAWSSPMSDRLSALPNGSEASLNAALDQATAWAAGRGASAVLILPADLPLVTVADVKRLWHASQLLYSTAAVVIAPDSREQGTNALLVRPPGILPYQFGLGSFGRHCEQARSLGLAWHICRSPRLGLDVDVPADLAHWLALERADLPSADRQSLETEETTVHDDRPLMAVDEATAAFLAEPNLLMRLGTLGSDGYPQVTPVWYLYEDGRFWITTASNRVKARNMLAHPQVGFAIDSDQRPYRGISARGKAQPIAEGEAARPMTYRIAARYVPAERLEAMVDTLMAAPRVVFAIEVSRVVKMGSW